MNFIFKIMLSSLSVLITFSALGLPHGAQTIQGAAQLSYQQNTLTIHNSDKTIINWQNFDIAPNQTTQFIQPSNSSSVLNRVISNNPSQILGNLKSNGQVFVINQHGILVGENARINTASFFASTLNITDSDFTNNRLKFSGVSSGKITNKGFIRAGEEGNIVLIASNIENGGVIEVQDGNVILAAGKSINIIDLDNSQVSFTIQADDNSVKNLGSIIAYRGAVSIFSNNLLHEGTIQATGFVTDKDGMIRLVALEDNIIKGELKAIDDNGGYIEVLGANITVSNNALLDASGKNQGGEILIGGDQQGLNPSISNAQSVTLSIGSSIRANALEAGNGGKIIVFANDDVHIHGELSAMGGQQSGNGGFIETSGLKQLDITAIPNASAINGKSGTWLIDPNNISIVAGSANTNINAASPFISSNDSAQLGADLITSALNAGTSVSITTGTGGTDAENGDINLDSAINSVTTLANVSLTLSAQNNININANISDTGLGLDLILNPNSDAIGGGIVNFAPSANSILTVKDITINGSSEINGDLVIFNTGNITLSAALTIKETFRLTLENDRNIIGTIIHEDGTLNNKANLTLQNYTFQGGKLEGSGTTTVTDNLLIEDGPTSVNSPTVDTQTLINSNNAQFTSALGGFYFNNNANFINNGTFIDTSFFSIGNIFDDSSTFTNAGTYIYNNSATFKSFYFPINNSGTFDIQDGKIEIIDKDGTTLNFDIGSGTLTGGGEIKANIIASSSSSIAPTVGSSILTIDGNVTFNSGSTLIIEQASTSAYSQLNVSGNVQIEANSTLTLTPINGYSATISDSFSDVLNGVIVSGTFSNINSSAYSISPTYNNNLSFTISQVNNLWTGAVDNNWLTPGNWSNGVPVNGDAVVINNGVTAVSASSINNTFASLSIAAGTTLSLDSSLITLSSDSILSGTLNLTLTNFTANSNLTTNDLVMDNSNLIGNNTNLTILNSANFNNTNSVSKWSNVNTNDINITGETQFTDLSFIQQNDINISDLNSSLTFNNSTLTSNSGSTFSGTGGGLNFVTTSQWNINNTVTNTGRVNIGVTNSGITLNNNAGINFSDPSIFSLYSLSSVNGSGSINATVNNISGSINPGTSTSVGSIDLIGGYSQGIQAFTYIDLINSGSSFDTFSVTGNTNLNGTLQVSNLGSNSLTSYPSISPLNFSSVAGKFSSVTDGTNTILGGFTNGRFTVLRSDINFNDSSLSFTSQYALSEVLNLTTEVANKAKDSLLNNTDNAAFTLVANSNSNSAFVCQ